MKTRPLCQILDELNGEIYLPHIQRPFVWGEEQVRKLLDSLLRGYPIQTLLFLWRTRDEIKARQFMDTIRRDVDLHTLYDGHASQEGNERFGYTVLTDLNDREVLAEGVHIVRLDGALLVKRLQRLPGKVPRVSSVNPAYEPFEIKGHEDSERDFAVIGRVRWGGIAFT